MPQVGFPRLYSVWGSGPDGRWDFVVGYPNWVNSIQNIKANINPALIALMSPLRTGNVMTDIPAVTYGPGYEDFPGATDNIIDGLAANAGVMRPYSVYWDKLYRPDGSVAQISPSWKHLGWNLANYPVPMGIMPTWENLGKVILYKLKINRLYRDQVWDGYHSDNWIYSIGASWFYGSPLDHDRDGVEDSASVLRKRWGNGLNYLSSYLATSLPGMITGGNGIYKASPREGIWASYHDDPNGWHKFSNYTLMEDGHRFWYSHSMAQRAIDICTSTNSAIDSATGASMLGWLNYPDFLGRERYFAVMFELHDDNGNVVPTPSNFNSPSVYKQEQYYRLCRKGIALGCCMGAYTYTGFVGHHESRLYYDDEMLGGVEINRRNWMGQPIALATSPTNGVFIREFEHGLAIVNVTSSPQTFPLPGGASTWKKITGTAPHNDGAIITSSNFTIPAHDGRLLVRVDSNPSLPPTNVELPSISGNPQVGQTLIPNKGLWMGSPIVYQYTFAKYSADGLTRISVLQQETLPSNATPSNYTVLSSDVGYSIRLEIVATNAYGSGNAMSIAFGPINAPPPIDKFESPPSAIFAFNVSTQSTPSSAYPPSPIFHFNIEAKRLINHMRTLQINRTIGTRRIAEGGGGG